MNITREATGYRPGAHNLATSLAPSRGGWWHHAGKPALFAAAWAGALWLVMAWGRW